MAYMALHGVLGRLTWVSLSFVVVACASGSEDDGNAESEIPAAPGDEVTSKKGAEAPPTFEPKFESPTAGTDPTKDPAPSGTSECVDANDPGANLVEIC